MKKLWTGLGILAIALALASAWLVWGSATDFSGEKYDLYVRTNMPFSELIQKIRKDSVVKSPGLLEWIARRMDYPAQMKAGKYEIKSGTSYLGLVHMLQKGRQTPVNLVITKLRTKEDLAGLVGKKLECDSAEFLHWLNNPDSLANYHLDSNTVMTAVFPNTYAYYWNTTPPRVFKKFFAEYKSYWTPARVQLASERGLNPTRAYILASLVEEETNKKEDRGKIASVYLNRLAQGMKLDADPTVKYALRDFELKRIYEKHLAVESPYNTYKNPGLPPGPICTPSRESLEAVLSSPSTHYLYFVARPDFSGFSNFSETYAQHMAYAKAYQQALNRLMSAGAASDKPGKP